MNDQDYKMIEGIRRSMLWQIRNTPMHFRYWFEHPEEETPALIFGRAAHKYILEPETFFDEFAVMPGIDRRTKAGKASYEHFKELAGDRTVISEEDLQILMEMRQAMLQNPEAKEILMAPETKTEQVYTWTDPTTGEKCKVKADIVTEINGLPLIVDYKTTGSCAGFDFERSCRKYGYDFQSGMYTEGIDIVTMVRHEFAFIAQEKTPPYAARVYYCDPSFVEHGKRIFHDLLDRFHTCVTTNEWNGYESRELFSEE